MTKILSFILISFLLSGCELYKFNGGGEKDNPTGGGTGTIGDAQEISLIGGSNQTALVNNALGSAFEAKVEDTKSRPIIGESILFELLDNFSSVVFSQVVTTNNDGIASLNFAPAVFGDVKVRISVVNSKNTVAPLEVPLVIIGQPYFITLTNGNNQTIPAGSNPAATTFELRDENGRLVPNGQVNIGGSNYNADSQGVVTYNHTGSATSVGSYNLVVSLPSTQSATLTYNVIPSAPSVLTVVSGNNQTITAGQTPNDFIVNLKDAYSNNRIGDTISFSGSNVVTDSNGDATYSPVASTVAGTHTVTATIGGLSSTFTYTVQAGALSSLELVSGNGQVLPRGVNSSSLQVRGKDGFSNIRVGDTISFTDNDSWSTTATLNGSGIASVVYPTPLMTGNKTITASSGGVSLNFSLEVKSYSPLTAVVSTSDDLTYSVITEQTFVSGDIVNNGPASVTNNSNLTSASTLSKSGTGVLFTNATPAETNLNTDILNVSSADDILSISSTATFPPEVSTYSCSQIGNVISGLTCVVNGTMTFRRDSILGGDFQIKVQSSNEGSTYDFLNSNTLPATKKIIIKKYNFPNGIGDIVVAGGDSTDKVIYYRDQMLRPAIFNYDTEQTSVLADNISLEGRHSYVHGGKFYFNGTNPNDSNQKRYLVYDPNDNSFAEAFRITTSADTIATSNLFEGNLYILSSASNRKAVVIQPDGSVSFNVSTTTVGGYIPFRRFAGVEYGYLNVLTAGIYKKTSATAILRLYQDSSYGPIQDNTTDNGFIVGANSYLYRYNETIFNLVHNKAVVSLLPLNGKMLVATKDSNNFNKIFVWDDSDNSFQKLTDFNTGASDFPDNSLNLIGVYNNNAYLCIQKAGTWTIYSYDGTKLSQLANSGINCSKVSGSSASSSAVVDNALWFGTNTSLYKICDQNLGCSN